MIDATTSRPAPLDSVRADPWPLRLVACGATACGVLSGLRIYVGYNLLGVQVTFLEGLTSGLLDWWLWIPFVPLVFGLARRFEPSGGSAVRTFAAHLGLGAAISFAQLTLYSAVSGLVRALRFGDPFRLDMTSPLLVMLAPGLLVYCGIVALAWWRASHPVRPAPVAPGPAPASGPAPPAPRMAFRAGRETVLLRADEIDWVSAAGNYLELHTGGMTHLVRETLKGVYERLGEERFVRIHRSTLVREAAIERYADDAVVLRDGTRLAVGRKFRGSLRP